MIEGFSFTDDVALAFEQVVLAAQEKATLSKGERAILKRMPKAERDRLKEEFLKEAETRKKSQLFLQVRELENKIEESDLPSDVKEKMLEMTQYALQHDMNFFYDVKQQINQMKAEAAAKEREKKIEETDEEEARIVTGAVVAGVAMGPFIQVRRNPKDWIKRTTDYYENKIIDELVAGKTDMTPPQMTYEKKQGSVYSKRHYQVEEQHKAEVQDLIVAQIQEKQKKAGIPVQTADQIVETLNHMHPVKQRAATRAIYNEHPELKQQHDTENKQVSSEEILRAMVRRERNAEKEAILALRKEQAALKKEGGEMADQRIEQLEKSITTRLEKSAALALFMEHFDAVMMTNETTATDLIKSGTVDGKVLIGTVMDKITSLDMKWFVSQNYAEQTQSEKEFMIRREKEIARKRRIVEQWSKVFDRHWEKNAKHITQSTKGLKTRLEKSAALGSFMEHFDTGMTANETTAADLIKSGSADGKKLIGSVMDQITSLNMTGFVAKDHARQAVAKGLSKTLAEHSTPIKTGTGNAEPAVAQQEESQKPAEMRLVAGETKGISKHLKDAAMQDEVPPQIKEVQDKIRETVEKVQTAKQEQTSGRYRLPPEIKEAWDEIIESQEWKKRLKKAQTAEQTEVSPKVKAVLAKMDKKVAKMQAAQKDQKTADNQMVLAALARKKKREVG